MFRHSRTTQRISPFTSRMRRLGASTALAFACCLLGPTQSADGCGGTPPPWDCGKAYVFTKNGNFQVLAGDAVNMPVTTFHFVSLVENVFSPTGCPNPVSVSMSATLACDPPPSAGPIDLGSFPVAEGQNIINVDVPIPAGPPRVCEFTITSTLTFDDGSSITQTAGDQVCVVVPVRPKDGRQESQITLNVNTNDVTCVHPGDQVGITIEVINNDDLPYSGEIVVCVESAAGLPAGSAGDTPTSGPFAPSDPQGDAFNMAQEDEIEKGGCVPFADQPQLQEENKEFITIKDLEPGSSFVTKVFVRPWGLCGDGSCNTVNIAVFGELEEGVTDPDAPDACRELSIVVDPTKPPQFEWDDSGRAADVIPVSTPIGNGIGFLLDPTVDGSQPSQVNVIADIANATFLVDGEVPSGFVQFPSVVTQTEGKNIRLVVDWSFINPVIVPGQVVTMLIPWIVQVDGSSAGDVEVMDVQTEVFKGAPTGVPNAPYQKVMVNMQGTGEGYEDFRFFFLHQTSVVGVTSQFDLVPATQTDIDSSQPFSDGFESGNISVWPKGGGIGLSNIKEGPSHPPFIGVSAGFDMRGFAEKAIDSSPCPQDLNGDGLVGPPDLALLLGAWGLSPGNPADFDGSGTVGPPDLAQLLGAWGPCP